MNKFKVGDLVQCIDAGLHGGVELTHGRLYQIRKVGETTVFIINDEGTLAAYYVSRFKLYQTQENSMPEIIDKSVEQCIKEFLKKLEYVLVNDMTIQENLDIHYDSRSIRLVGDYCDIVGVDDIYTYVNNSYDQLTSQAAQKRKQELLDKKAKLDVELAQINKELEGL
jgi:small-conductance mechanosensitive channel